MSYPIIQKHSQYLLIVNDDVLSMMVLTQLVDTGCKEINKTISILKAENGKKALEQYQSIKGIKCIFMDINMPEINGYDCTQHIRNFEK